MQLKGLFGWSLAGALATSAVTWFWIPVSTAASAATPAASVPAPLDGLLATADVGGALRLEARVGDALLLPGKPGETQLLVEVSAPKSSTESAAPLNVVLVVDRSGSMKGARMTQAVEAGRRLVAKLRDGDRVAVVSYAVTPEIVLPLTLIDADSRARAAASLSTIVAKGDTCLSCGIDSALGLLASGGLGVPHMILLSDGEANRGLTQLTQLRELGTKAKRQGVSISSVGVDLDYDERALSVLASASDGRHHFVPVATQLQSVVEQELAELVTASALETELVVELPEGVTVTRAHDRSVQQVGRTVTIPLGTFTSGDKKTLLLELSVPPGEADAGARFALSLSGVVGKERTPLRQAAAVGVRFSAQAASSTPDPIVRERLQRARTLGALLGANRAFKQGNLKEAEAKLDSALAAVEGQAASESSPVAAARLKRQSDDLKASKKEYRAARGAACACAPGDLMCAMSCTGPATKPGEKAAAKRIEAVANPYSR